MLSPRESAKFISEVSEHVKINSRALKILGDKIIREINTGNFTFDNLSCDLFPKASDEWAMDWFFVVNSISFCLWFPKTKLRINDYRGSMAIYEAINQARRKGIDILNPEYYSTISHEALANILKDDRNIPVRFIQKRQEILHDMGMVLIKKFNSSFRNVVVAADNSAVKLMNLLVDNFPHFYHVAYYHRKKVSFFKRAKSLVSQVWICMRNEGIGYFPDIGELTGIASYRIPQCLAYLEVLKYSNELKEKIEKKKIIPVGSEMEVELYGCSVHAIELLKDYALNKIHEGKLFNALIIDGYLFEFRRKHPVAIGMIIDFHKTISTHF